MPPSLTIPALTMPGIARLHRPVVQPAQSIGHAHARLAPVARVRHHGKQVEVTFGSRFATSVRAADDDAQRVEPIDQARSRFGQLLDNRLWHRTHSDTSV